MKKLLFIQVILVILTVNGWSQQLFVPNGFSASGVGSSANSTNVGIGTSNPQWGLLQLNASNDNTIALRMQMGSFSMGGNATFAIDAPGIGGGRLFIGSNGNIGIGKNIPNYRLDVGGDINFTGNLLKNGQPFSSGSSVWTKDASNNISYSGGNVNIQDGGFIINAANPFLDVIYNNCNDCGGKLYHKFLISDNNIGINVVGQPSDLPTNVSGVNGLYVGGAIATFSNTYNPVLYNRFGVETIDGQASGYISTSGDITRFCFFKEGAGYQSIVAANATFNGKLTSTEVEIKQDVWHDDVFKPDYKLMPLNELEKFINTNQHLPEVPTDAEVKKNGVNMAEMNALLIKKVEELTKYVIDLKKEIDDLKKK
jgi:hypothetical protein